MPWQTTYLYPSWESIVVVTSRRTQNSHLTRVSAVFNSHHSGSFIDGALFAPTADRWSNAFANAVADVFANAFANAVADVFAGGKRDSVADVFVGGKRDSVADVLSVVSVTPWPLVSVTPSANQTGGGADPTLVGAAIIGIIAVGLMVGFYYTTRRM